MEENPPPFPGQPPPVVRTRVVVTGWLMVVLGLFLSVAMVALTAHLAPLVNAAPGRANATRYTGTHEMTVMMFTLFGTIFVFGLVTTANGAWALRHGRQNTVLRVLVGILGIGLFVGGAYIAATFR